MAMAAVTATIMDGNDCDNDDHGWQWRRWGGMKTERWWSDEETERWCRDGAVKRQSTSEWGWWMMKRWKWNNDHSFFCWFPLDFLSPRFWRNVFWFINIFASELEASMYIQFKFTN
jgi:hypothetical protein